MSQRASCQFTKSCVPAEGFIQILTVAAACALADVTLTATQRVVWLRRLQLFPLHYDLLNSLQALSPTKSAYSKGKNFTLGTSHQKKLPHQNTQMHLKSQIFLFIFCTNNSVFISIRLYKTCHYRYIHFLNHFNFHLLSRCLLLKS